MFDVKKKLINVLIYEEIVLFIDNILFYFYLENNNYC